MKCPFCNGEMEQGRLFNGRMDIPLFWMPVGYVNKHSLKGIEKLTKEHNGIILDPWLLRKEGSYLHASVCRQCGKLIADFPNND